MKVLITGITGFAGSHLADYLLANEPTAEVAGLYRWRSRTENVEHLAGRVALVECDVRDATATREAVESFRPDFIFHLAAQSFVPSSWRAPQETLSTNLLGQLNIFEAVRKSGLNCRIQIAGSSEEYGLVHPHELPIKEDQPLRPLSPYAVSKVAQDALAYQYFMSYGMPIIRTRGFNHTGPRRGEVFVTSNFAKQVATIEAGKAAPVIKVGNLDAVRDFTDVRDMVRGYVLATEKGKPGEVYNLASGKAITIRAMLDKLIAMARVEVKVETDPARLRPSDVEVLIGDYSKFHADTGWEPKIPFDQTLEDLLNYWRQRIARK